MYVLRGIHLRLLNLKYYNEIDVTGFQVFHSFLFFWSCLKLEIFGCQKHYHTNNQISTVTPSD